MTATTLPVKEAVNIFYARQYAYDILRRFFIEEPSKDYLKEFVQKNMIDVFPFIEDSAEIHAGVYEVKEHLANHDVTNIEKHYDDLHWEYTRLFIGPFKLPVPPWESTYVRKDQLLFQGTTMNVRQYYEKYGFIVRDFNMEADDHVGLELDFMYHLNELCIEMAQANDIQKLKYLLKDQNKFLNEHLLAFVPKFCGLVIEEADTTFYRGLARILQNYLLIDSQILQELKDIDIS